jgi:hypothetical protein
MPGTKQPTPVDESVYERFVQFVEDVHGTTRGHLRTEIENALRQYRESYYGESQRLSRIEDDVAQVKQLVAQMEADGGTRPDSSQGRVRARADRAPAAADDVLSGQVDQSDVPRPGEKPAANQPRGEKVQWLAASFLASSAVDPESGQFHTQDIETHVRDAYGFQDDTVQEYVGDVLDVVADALDAEQHPNNADLRVWGDELDNLLESLEDDASSRMDDLTDD